MPAKQFFVDNLGEVKVYKRRGSKRISLRIVGNHIQVTQPTWLPYASGLQFATSHQAWIGQQKQAQHSPLPQPDAQIGKLHTLRYQVASALKAKVTTNEVIITIPPHLHIHSPQVLEATKKATKKALKNEAEVILRQRLDAIANQFNLAYRDVYFKNMRSRWGSCNSQHNISLNISLLLLPYELIDYVILHELMHTKYLNHSKAFWAEVGAVMPDYKQRRKTLKNVQHTILSLH
jgi:predicted metal-dependent hydrolase